MSVTAVGGSYAAMVGIEGYMKTKGKWKGMQDKFKGMVVGPSKKDGKGAADAPDVVSGKDSNEEHGKT